MNISYTLLADKSLPRICKSDMNFAAATAVQLYPSKNVKTVYTENTIHPNACSILAYYLKHVLSTSKVVH